MDYQANASYSGRGRTGWLMLAALLSIVVYIILNKAKLNEV